MAAPNGLIVAWPSTAASIPAGWSRYTTLDSRLPKPAASSIGTAGGSDTHTHSTTSHSHSDAHAHGNTSSGSSSGVSSTKASGSNLAQTTHTHAITVTAAALTTDSQTGTSSSGTSVDFANVTVIWIQSDGTTDIPTNAVAYSSQSSVPTGWSAYANGINAFLRGAAAAADGGTVNAASTHTHTYSHTHTSNTSHSHNVSTIGNASSTRGVNPGGVTGAAASHTHSSSGSTDAATHSTASGSDAKASGTGTSDPPYYKLQTVQASGAALAPRGIIALWTTTTPPTGWAACDGSNGTPNLHGQGRFIKGANGTGEIGNTDAGSAHTHSGTSHTHTLGTGTHGVTSISLGASSGTSTNSATGGSNLAVDAHTHTFSGSSGARVGPTGSQTYTYSATTIDPAYVNMYFIMALGQNPFIGLWADAQAAWEAVKARFQLAKDLVARHGHIWDGLPMLLAGQDSFPPGGAGFTPTQLDMQPRYIPKQRFEYHRQDFQQNTPIVSLPVPVGGLAFGQGPQEMRRDRVPQKKLLPGHQGWMEFGLPLLLTGADFMLPFPPSDEPKYRPKRNVNRTTGMAQSTAVQLYFLPPELDGAQIQAISAATPPRYIPKRPFTKDWSWPVQNMLLNPPPNPGQQENEPRYRPKYNVTRSMGYIQLPMTFKLFAGRPGDPGLYDGVREFLVYEGESSFLVFEASSELLAYLGEAGLTVYHASYDFEWLD